MYNNTVVKMEKLPKQRLDTVLALVHLDINSCIKSKIFPEEHYKQGNKAVLPIQSASYYHPLKTFFDSGYFSLAFPFRFVKDELHQYQLKTSALRKCISFLVFLSTLLYYFTTARNRLAVTQKSAVITYFYVVHNVFHFIMIVCFYDALFRKSHVFLKLMRELASSNLIHCNSRKLRIGNYVFHIVYLGGTVLLQLVDYPIGADWSLTGITRFFINLARYTFFLDNNPKIIGGINFSTTHDENWTISDYSLCILQIVIVGAYTLVTSFFTAAYLYAPISLWVAVKRFTTEVVPQHISEESDEVNFLRVMQTKSDQVSSKLIGDTIVQKYKELHVISSLFNCVWGIFYFMAILDYIVWLATDLDVGIKAKDWLSRTSSAWHFGNTMLLLFFSSECFRMMSSFRTWLVRFGKQIFVDENELNGLINLVDTENVGIGLNGLYKVNYSFTGQVSTIIITFFIITLQYERNVDHLA